VYIGFSGGWRRVTSHGVSVTAPGSVMVRGLGQWRCVVWVGGVGRPEAGLAAGQAVNPTATERPGGEPDSQPDSQPDDRPDGQGERPICGRIG
jgi:hypothetical protein